MTLRPPLEQIDASIMDEFEVLEAPRRTKQGALPDDERSPYWDDDGHAHDEDEEDDLEWPRR